jgi:hypothetical protein
MDSVAAVYSFCAFWLIYILFLGSFTNTTPTHKEISAGCIRHGGVRSISNGSIDNSPVIVCKDGKFWFAK